MLWNWAKVITYACLRKRHNCFVLRWEHFSVFKIKKMLDFFFHFNENCYYFVIFCKNTMRCSQVQIFSKQRSFFFYPTKNTAHRKYLLTFYLKWKVISLHICSHNCYDKKVSPWNNFYVFSNYRIFSRVKYVGFWAECGRFWRQ